MYSLSFFRTLSILAMNKRTRTRHNEIRTSHIVHSQSSLFNSLWFSFASWTTKTWAKTKRQMNLKIKCIWRLWCEQTMHHHKFMQKQGKKRKIENITTTKQNINRKKCARKNARTEYMHKNAFQITALNWVKIICFFRAHNNKKTYRIHELNDENCSQMRKMRTNIMNKTKSLSRFSLQNKSVCVYLCVRLNISRTPL